MNYQQTLNYLYAKLPMFTRVGAVAYKADIGNTVLFCNHLGNPEKKFKTIHVGGTNGKGSTSHMLAAILQKAGYKTGLYTSPHLKDFRERIKINGEMIAEQEVINFVAENEHLIEEISPSFFEVTVALAFDYFAKQQVDIAIIEVGLGGRLDSTNIISPEISVITNISFDHMNILGNTLIEIAGEKAGIIKEKTPVIIGEFQEEVAKVFIAKAEEKNAPIFFASNEWEISENEVIDLHRKATLQQGNRTFNLELDLTGSYQLKNVKTVLTAIDQIRLKGFEINDEDIESALSQVKKLTGLMGRWQILNQEPLIICDTGHNEDGIKEVLKNIEATPHQNLLMVIGMVKDKDISKVLSLLPKNAEYFFCSPDMPRAKPAEELMQEALAFDLKGEAFASIKCALIAAKYKAKPQDLIFIGGSTFVVAEVV
ncbi:bifunctional folylpolyglutamate synthase/dihydrofolate synthase [Pedobacter cryophilus]|uniref:Dihydrofolate synthase/folylpolyglutamate synthase n=1 Tax=Pedobacter cryophilus TaxID=2571271 RepID=A0A4V6WMV7_9SPHI|nr:folylpolyglutamate synthase/dihydrofolate synthase family protein [Pedobacter cryophilus]TKB96780.1 bifunctional folylpolyglutamate synthase/dihydrofolate synthase [Pedobacter cryophilus]